MTSSDFAHKSWWQIFEVVFGIPFFAAIGLQLLVPFSLPLGLLAQTIIPGDIALFLLGVALFVVGAAIIMKARRELARHGQPTDPGLATSKIVTTGVFSISRNPVYLGGVCVIAGFALALNLPWVLVLLPAAVVACHYVLIAPEERYLAAKFGDEYARYAASVHRWIGRRRIPRER